MINDTYLYEYAKKTIHLVEITSTQVDDCIEDLIRQVKHLEKELEASQDLVEQLQEEITEMKRGAE